jgi:hypothetical protein
MAEPLITETVSLKGDRLSTKSTAHPTNLQIPATASLKPGGLFFIAAFRALPSADR